jgi:hypothetical protein
MHFFIISPLSFRAENNLILLDIRDISVHFFIISPLSFHAENNLILLDIHDISVHLFIISPLSFCAENNPNQWYQRCNHKHRDTVIHDFY